MINFHKWILAGLFFIILDIWIVIDIFPDFIGVFFIANAFSKAKGSYAKWGYWSSLILGVLLIPSVFAEVANTPANVQNTFFVVTNHLISYLYVILYAAFFYVSNERIGEVRFGKLARVFLTFQILIIAEGIVSPHISYSTMEDLGVFVILMLGIFWVIYIILIVRIWKRTKLENAFMKMSLGDSSEETE